LDGSEDNLLFGYENLLGSVNDDEEIEDPNDQSSNEEYFEEDNYKNNWDIRNDANKIDNEIDNENCIET
ncbi:3406_t:CDS:1, partial [Funneliformis geosporum]